MLSNDNCKSEEIEKLSLVCVCQCKQKVWSTQILIWEMIFTTSSQKDENRYKIHWRLVKTRMRKSKLAKFNRVVCGPALSYQRFVIRIQEVIP